MQQAIVERSIPLLAGMIGANTGVKVVFTGDQACTDGKTIRLPPMASGAPDEVEKVLGYTWHEADHIRYTDFECGRPSDRIRMAIANIIEDVRIELRGVEEFPGQHYRLERLISHLATEGMLFGAPEDVDATNALLGWVLNWTRANINGYRTIKHLDAWQEAFDEHFPKLGWRVKPCLMRCRDLENTAEAIQLADEVVKIVEDALKQDPPPDADDPESQNQQQPQGDDGSSSDAGADAGDQDENGDDQNDQTGDGSDQDGQSDGDDQADDGNDSGDQAGDSKGGSDDGTGDGDDQPDDSGDSGTAPQGAGTEADGDDAQATDPSSGQGAGGDDDVQLTDDDRERLQQSIRTLEEADDDSTPETDLGEMVQEAIEEIAERHAREAARNGDSLASIPGLELATGQRGMSLQNVRASSAALRSRLNGLFESEQYSGHRGTAKRGKRLHPKHFKRVLLDDPRVFRAKRDDIEVNGAVHLLLDISGSMKGRERELADAAMATSLALQELDGLDVSVSAFPWGSGLMNLLLLRQGERLEAAAARFGQIRSNGWTPMGPAIRASLPLLNQAKDRDQYLVIFTDGQPDSAPEVEAALKSAPLVRPAAVILGSCPNDLESIMSSRRMASLAEMPNAVSQLMREIVLKPNRRKAA